MKPVEILWKNTPLFVEISNQPILSHQIRPDFHNPSTGFPQPIILGMLLKYINIERKNGEISTGDGPSFLYILLYNINILK
jgi:hypothetical protein